MAFTAQQIRGGLLVDPFATRATWYESMQEWGISWRTPDTADGPGEEVAIAGFRESDDGIEWVRFHVRDEFRGHGIYTKALAWSLSLGVEVHTYAPIKSPEEWDGFSQQKDGRLRMDKRKAKARVKPR